MAARSISPSKSAWSAESVPLVARSIAASYCCSNRCFRWRNGQGGELKHVPLERAQRPPVEKFLGAQRRFDHLVHAKDGQLVVRPGREAEVAALQAYADRTVERLARYATR